MWFTALVSAIGGIMLHQPLLVLYAAFCVYMAIEFPEYPRHPRYRHTPEEKRAYRLRQRNLRRVERQRQWRSITDIFFSKSDGYRHLRFFLILSGICLIIVSIFS
jgi:hypothetical protein